MSHPLVQQKISSKSKLGCVFRFSVLSFVLYIHTTVTVTPETTAGGGKLSRLRSSRHLSSQFGKPLVTFQSQAHLASPHTFTHTTNPLFMNKNKPQACTISTPCMRMHKHTHTHTQQQQLCVISASLSIKNLLCVNSDQTLPDSC